MAQGSRRRGRIFIYIALIIILLIALIWLVLNKMGGFGLGAQQEPTTVVQDMVDIVFTSQAVPRGEYFTDTMLSTRQMPRTTVADGSFYTSILDVVGKRAAIDLDAGMPVTPSMAVDVATSSKSAFKIPQGMVALSVPINMLTSVSYAPQEGDHVNIIASVLFVDLDADFQSRLPNNTAVVTAPTAPDITESIAPGGPAGRGENDNSIGQPMYAVPSEAQRPRLVSHTLIQNAIVLHVGRFDLNPQPAPTTAEDGTTAPAEETVVEVPTTITLIVTPQDAITLNYLVNSSAQLTLALRGAGDEQIAQTEAVTLQYLLDHYGIPVPAKLSVGIEPRTDQLINPLYDIIPQ
ncbi:MAG TPA: SAF domain-containing protein [Anaerolineaceae bacterium]|nr:SAF domain-containing protein [Anaerolineaceae bacterium]